MPHLLPSSIFAVLHVNECMTGHPTWQTTHTCTRAFPFASDRARREKSITPESESERERASSTRWLGNNITAIMLMLMLLLRPPSRLASLPLQKARVSKAHYLVLVVLHDYYVLHQSLKTNPHLASVALFCCVPVGMICILHDYYLSFRAPSTYPHLIFLNSLSKRAVNSPLRCLFWP